MGCAIGHAGHLGILNNSKSVYDHLSNVRDNLIDYMFWSANIYDDDVGLLEDMTLHDAVRITPVTIAARIMRVVVACPVDTNHA